MHKKTKRKTTNTTTGSRQSQGDFQDIQDSQDSQDSQDFYGMDLPALNHTEQTTLTHINKAHTPASIRERETEFKKSYQAIHQAHPGTCQPIMRTWFLLKKDDQGGFKKRPLDFGNEADLVNYIFQYLNVALGIRVN